MYSATTVALIKLPRYGSLGSTKGADASGEDRPKKNHVDGRKIWGEGGIGIPQSWAAPCSLCHPVKAYSYAKPLLALTGLPKSSRGRPRMLQRRTVLRTAIGILQSYTIRSEWALRKRAAETVEFVLSRPSFGSERPTRCANGRWTWLDMSRDGACLDNSLYCCRHRYVGNRERVCTKDATTYRIFRKKGAVRYQMSRKQELWGRKGRKQRRVCTRGFHTLESIQRRKEDKKRCAR